MEKRRTYAIDGGIRHEMRKRPDTIAGRLRTMSDPGDITLLLRDIEADRPGAHDALAERVYADLERMASGQLRRRFGARAGEVTLEPAALVNESFLKLIRGRGGFDDRGHFFGAATRAMLQVLTDYSRRRGAAKRGGDGALVTVVLDWGQVADRGRPMTETVEVEALSSAIVRLESESTRTADVIKLRVVWGLDLDAIGAALGVSRSTVDREWRFARAWLREELHLPAG